MFEVPLYYFLGSCSFDCFHEWQTTGEWKYFWGMNLFNLIGFVFYIYSYNEDKKQWKREYDSIRN